MSNNASGKAIATGIALLVVLSLIGGVAAYRQVPEGHQGVEKEWGAVTGDTLSSGAHWKIPVMESVQSVETRPRTYTMSATTDEGQKTGGDAVTVKTVNGSSVNVDVTVRYRINPEDADTFVSDWNNEQQMESRLIRPTIRTVLRDEASSLQTTGNDAIYTQEGRAALETAALGALKDDFSDEPITLEAVQIRNIDLPQSIDEALDQKEQAKQQVEVEQQKVKQEEAKKQQRIVQAEADAAEVRIAAQADANATRIRGEALNDFPIVLTQQQIDAYREAGAIYVGADGGITLTRETRNETNTSTNSTSTNSTVQVTP
jgi:regulator of protease activity HflC (stomatin/prohibitin superfamily)